jgi:NADPH:quinone reductase-like Zn-dependent oxidoreductase
MSIREGYLHELFPATFPTGQGSDLAGEVVATGDGVTGFTSGDEVFGWSDERSAHAEYVAVPADQLAPKPADLSFEQAGSLHVVGATAVAAVRAVDPRPGETVVISGAAGGVGVLTTQLAVATGATVIGLAGPTNHDWLRSRGAVPLVYGDGLVERLADAAPNGVDAFIDLFGGGYVAMALDELDVKPDRVNTIIDFAAAAERGVKAEGNTEGADIADLADLANRIASGELELPIAATYPLAEVRDAYTELAHRHTHGKIVLLP